MFAMFCRQRFISLHSSCMKEDLFYFNVLFWDSRDSPFYTLKTFLAPHTPSLHAFIARLPCTPSTHTCIPRLHRTPSTHAIIARLHRTPSSHAFLAIFISCNFEIKANQFWTIEKHVRFSPFAWKSEKVHSSHMSADFYG